MVITSTGIVEAASVREAKRVHLQLKDGETIRLRLSKARNYGKVQLGQVAVLNDREFLRVDASKFKGIFWVEII